MLEIVIVLVSVLPVLLPVDVNAHDVEPGIAVGIGHHDHRQADAHTVVYRHILRGCILPGLGKERDVLTGHT